VVAEILSGTIVLNVLLSAALGVVARYCFLSIGQSWANSFTSFLVFSLLPAATYSITSIISGDLALSLGMVGALSIVRFRNPVRSPAELVAYFVLVTIGICMTKDILVCLVLVCLIVIITQTLRLLIRFNIVSLIGVVGLNDLGVAHVVCAQTNGELPQKLAEEYEQYLAMKEVINSDIQQVHYRWELRDKVGAIKLMAKVKSSQNLQSCSMSSSGEKL
jgi:hypothetical protein